MLQLINLHCTSLRLSHFH